MHMDYRYLSVFHVSGIKLPDGSSQAVIRDSLSTGRRIAIRSDIDSCCFLLDRGTAIATMMLQAVFGGGSGTSSTGRIEKEVEQIRDKRRRKFGSGPFVVLEFSGEVDADPAKPFEYLEDSVVSFDLIDKSQIRAQFKNEIERLLMSFFLATGRDFDVKKVKDGIYLINQGKVWYSFAPGTSAKCVVSKPVDHPFLSHLSDYSSALGKTGSLQNVYRLLVQSSDRDGDNLRSFLFGWTALEVFINKMFKQYEERFFDAYVAGEMSSPARRLIDSLRSVMKSKYTLKDKFMVISAFLSTEPERDLEEFVSGKEMRDRLSHGEPIAENNLPTEAIVLLLRRYLLNHLVPTNA